MKPASKISPQKLRGGFYTPGPLVSLGVRRLEELLPTGGDLSLLEPSVGDGAFLEGLASSGLRERISRVVGLEPQQSEALKAEDVLLACALKGAVHRVSAVRWCANGEACFDGAIGNPPFVRFQYAAAADRAVTQALGRRLGITFKSVSNLWIPVLLGAIGMLRADGGFAFVVPAECLTGFAAGAAREWLLAHTNGLHLDLFPSGSFPEVIQEVLLISGRRAPSPSQGPTELAITEHRGQGFPRRRSHKAWGGQAWTRYLLRPDQLAALEQARQSPAVRPLADLAVFEVSTVTGANGYFSVDEATVHSYELEPWARPLLPRIRHAPGLRYTADDRRVTERSGSRAWLLDFAADAPDPMASALPRAYLDLGVAEQLPRRYKCRVRVPWYRVPSIRPGELMLSKRSHLFTRVVLNEQHVLTTDTIYRGRVLEPAVLSARSLACGFHNSLTLLSAELEGRSFGGGVLELVPSEIARLSLAVWQAGSRALDMLDLTARQTPERLIAHTDRALVSAGVLPDELLRTLAEARELLLARRLSRNRALSSTPSARPMD